MAEGVLKNRLLLLVTGLILGVLIYLGPSIILSILISWGIYTFLSKRPQSETRALTKIVLVALILRVIFFVITLYIVYCANLDVSEYPVGIVGHTTQVVRDFDREIKNGIAIARYLRGDFGNVPLKDVSFGGHGFLHVGAWTQGILNYLFGVSPFNLLLFPLIDLWTVIIVYYLAKLLFNTKVAAFSSFIYAITPSTIVISCTNLRFSLSIFSLLLITLSLVLFVRVSKFGFLLLLGMGVILFIIFREKASKPLLIILPFVLLLVLKLRVRTKFLFLAMATIFFVILLAISTFVQNKFFEMLQNLIVSQVGFTNVEGSTDYYSNYRIYDEIVYSRDIKTIPPMILIRTLPKGLFRGFIYFMFAPFPWDVTNTARLYFYPQVIFWYFIIPFGIFGMVRSLFYKQKEALSVILLCGYFVILLSLVLGNEGIAARYRELITPFFYIFAGSILCRFVS